ncbi:hypothetical protein JST97_25375 [bacterium]|nr:hypothetical protein [bacterium]
MASQIPTFTPPTFPSLTPPGGMTPVFQPVALAPAAANGALPFSPAAPMRRDQVLRILDDFVSMPFAPPSHGQTVDQAVRATGYQGQIDRAQYPHENMTDDVARASFNALSRPGMSAEDARAALNRYFVNQNNSTLNGAAQALNQDARAGVTNSVTNISYGAGAAPGAQSIYRMAREGWGPPPPPAPAGAPGTPQLPDPVQARYENSRNMMTNLANAWGIDPAALSSTDPAVNGPARQRFQQNLLNQAQASAQDPGVQGALQNYQRAEQAYTNNNNSVVVSAGNWGGLLNDMRQDNGNRPLEVGKDFNTNLLVGQNSISVGALDINPQTGAPQVAGYSNADSRVDLYAYGDIQGSSGTSFAAPRVAAVTQAVRLEMPNASAAEVRQRVMQIFTTQGPGAAEAGSNQEQSGNVANYLGQVQWPRQTYVIPGMPAMN